MNIRSKSDARKYYSDLKKRGKLCGTIKRAVELWQKRRQEPPHASSGSCLGRWAIATTIPLGPETASGAAERAEVDHPRRRNWEEPKATRTLARPWGVVEVDNGRYSSRCTFTHWTYVPYCQSMGFCCRGHLVVKIGGTYARHKAPYGWHFGRDRLGLYIAPNRLKSECWRYHFSSDDALDRRKLLAAARDHVATQRQKRREAEEQRRVDEKWAKLRAEALELGVWVSACDSKDAGNCAVGTARWAEDHGLDIRRHYPLKVIERAGRNGNQAQVKRACEQAITRTVLDLMRGYCKLEVKK